MRLRFDARLSHQRAPVAAVVDLLEGQRKIELDEAMREGGDVVANVLDLPDAALRRNLAAVQRRAGLPEDETLAWIEAPGDAALRPPTRFCNFTVEMETGTGKTYVYLRTALSLADRFGLRKFVIVVPSVAIREGVLKTLQVTRAHFAGLFPTVPYRFFAYDSSHLSRVRAFAGSGDVELMVVTIDAFNKASNVLRRPHDGFGGRVPLDLVRHTRPVLLLDEPQNLESELSRRSLTDLRPILALRYSATHRHPYALVHRLGPAAAHAAGLVKRVEVAGVVPTGDERADARRRLEVAVEVHVRRQAALRERGIKVLTLVLVDRVDSYLGPDPWIREAFDAAWSKLSPLDPAASTTAPARVRAAYFAPRGGRVGAPAVDSKSGEALADRAAYELIMRDKERLLSLQEPVAFVFSHSALREGWDNPNVAVVCALSRARSARRRRQEVGRGLRLCVDQSGRRVEDPACNVLTVVADEDYESFVTGLQAEEQLPVPEATPVDRHGAPSTTAVATEAHHHPRPLTPAEIDELCGAISQWPAPHDGDSRAPTWPDAIDAITDAMLTHDPIGLVSRATLLRLVAADPHPQRWSVEPSRSARRFAELIAVRQNAPNEG